jgi:hypothetical protein
MSMRSIFYVLMLIWLVFGIVNYTGVGGPQISHYSGVGGSLFEFILFLLVGWKVFGRPISDV